MKHIILISTFNGEKFIYQQLESIKKSIKENDVTLLIYDDNSSDNTKNIIEKFSNKINIIFLRYQNLDSVSENFKYLLIEGIKLFGENNIFYFCDQDDLWHESKISTTQTILRNTNAPLLLSNVECFGKVQKVISPRLCRNLLIDLTFNVAPGMSMSFIPSRFNKSLETNLKHFLWHDHDLFLLSKFFGPNPIKSQNTLQFYRRHNNAYMNNNPINLLSRFIYFLKNFFSILRVFINNI